VRGHSSTAGQRERGKTPPRRSGERKEGGENVTSSVKMVKLGVCESGPLFPFPSSLAASEAIGRRA